MVVGFFEAAIPSLPANTLNELRVDYNHMLRGDFIGYFTFVQWMPQKYTLMIFSAWETRAQPAILELKRI